LQCPRSPMIFASNWKQTKITKKLLFWLWIVFAFKKLIKIIFEQNVVPLLFKVLDRFT
jgi:hypothetical protein